MRDGVGNVDDAEYALFQAHMAWRFTRNASEPIFQTDAVLYQMYLEGFPAANRQYHTCYACRRFIECYGGLVTIDERGETNPLFWNVEDAPPEERSSIALMCMSVRHANVTGPFLTSENLWGEPVTGVWQHLHLIPPPSMLYPKSVLTPDQAMAEKREEFKNVRRALIEFPAEILQRALTLLETESLYRSENVSGPARWLANLQTRHALAPDHETKRNIIWRAVATAPAGFCHPRSSMIGTLLEDLATGMDFAQVSRRFAAKMNPSQYMRPSAPPASGTIAQAEKLVAELGIERSLSRRYARIDEIDAVWRPSMPVPEVGVFGYLNAAPKTLYVDAPMQTMTWEKFRRIVLPTAERIEFLTKQVDSYSAFTTAVHADAPPILQWDSEGHRNPFGWYFWNGGAPSSQYGLAAGVYYTLAAIALKPSMDRAPHHGHGVMFVIRSARETRNGGLALFPEMLRSELHGVRSVVEAHSRVKQLEGIKDSSVCGVMADGGNFGIDLKVTTASSVVRYRLDRWD